MVKPLSTLTLPNLIGVTVADSRCVLTQAQFAHLGMLLLQIRPHDARAICFLGGALSGAASQRRQEPNVFALDGDLGDDPFLVIAGQQGAVALMAAEAADGFHTRLYSDPDLVDRAALVLSQFSDHSYSLDAICDPEAQSQFMAVIASRLSGDPGFAGVDLGALLHGDRRWLDLASALRAVGQADLLRLPLVQQVLAECATTRVLVGSIDSEARSLHVAASDGSAAPGIWNGLPQAIAAMVRSRRAVGVSAADSAGLRGELGDWVAGKTLLAVPVIHDERVIGALLATSERPFSAHARALLNGLGSLLAAGLQRVQVPALPPAAPDFSDMPSGFSDSAPAANGAASSSGMLSLAARLSRGKPATQPVAPAAMALPAAPPPAPTLPSTSAPAARAEPSTPPRPAASLAQRTMAIARSGESASADLGTLLAHLSDGVVAVDSQGRLVAFSATAMRMLGLSAEARGRSLVESGALCLAPLFTEAIIGDLAGPREVELPTGQRAIVEVISLNAAMWAFVLHTDGTRPAVPESVANAQLPMISDGERNESFLSNFSNIIRVPLRELRELITQVPAAGNLNEQQSRLIGQVVRLNSELTMLVNDLLALGQIRLQATESRVPLRIDLLVEAAVGTQYAEFGRRGQHVTTEIQSSVPRITGSEEGLGRVVAALIDNAIKYSPAGAQIKVAVNHVDSDVVVSVQDNGPGLEAEELAQVFDPFFRARAAETMGVAGRGLGLTIAKAVIEQHGGHIWATASPGQGCAFSFSIPCE